MVRAIQTALLSAAAISQGAHAQATSERTPQQNETVLPAVTVTGAATPGVTENTQSYTTGAMSTATGLSLSIRDTPQSVSVVTRQEIEDRGLQTTADIIQSAPGISGTRSDTNRYAFSARGFSIDNYQFDGLTTPVLSPWNFGETNLDSIIYDRVEVVRGATGLMTGAGNPSAAINFVRKRPLPEFAVSAGAAVGSWNLKRTYVDVSSPLAESGRVRGRLVAAYSNVDSYTSIQDTSARTLYGVVTAELTPNTELTTSLSYQANANNGFGSGFPLFYSDGSRTDFGRSASNNANWARMETETTTGLVDLSHRFANDWTARAAYTQSYTDISMKQIFRGGYPNRMTGLGTSNSFSYYDGGLRRNTMNLTLSGPFELLGRRHEVSLGWVRSVDKLALPQYAAQRPLPTVGNYFDWGSNLVREPNWSDQKTQADDLNNRQSGAYAVGRFSLADPLHVIVGGRLSHWETNQTYFGTKRSYKYDNEFVPYAGILYDINDTYTVYTSYTEIFKPQNNRDADGNILSPISGKSYELGLKGAYLDGRLNGAVALFQTKQDNLAQIIPGETVGGVPGTQAYRAAKGAKVEGFELEVSGELTPGWNLAGSYTHLTAKDATGRPINTAQPRRLFKLFTTYRLPGDFNRLTVGGGVDWQSRMYQNAIAPGNRTVAVEQSSYALVNLMARYEFTKQVSATLNVNNLFDKKYYSQIGFYNQGWYGAPRNAMLSLRAQY